MPAFLSFEKQITVIGALCEGSSIRSVERMTGVHRDTIMRLGVRVGEACAAVMDRQMRELTCERIEVDEIWGYVGKKQRNLQEGDSPEHGDVWTFVAIDPVSKAVPAFRVGKRDYSDTVQFVGDVSARMKNRIQLSSDGMIHYAEAVEEEFGGDVDYGQIVKVYRSPDAPEGQRRYSPPEVSEIRRIPLTPGLDARSICTSYVERQNLTMRMHCRRLTRLTNAFSKKLDNFKAAIALHFAYYNYVKMHGTIRCTPAMALGVSSRLWTVADLVDLTK